VLLTLDPRIRSKGALLGIRPASELPEQRCLTRQARKSQSASQRERKKGPRRFLTSAGPLGASSWLPSFSTCFYHTILFSPNTTKILPPSRSPVNRPSFNHFLNYLKPLKCPRLSRREHTLSRFRFRTPPLPRHLSIFNTPRTAPCYDGSLN